MKVDLTKNKSVHQSYASAHAGATLAKIAFTQTSMLDYSFLNDVWLKSVFINSPQIIPLPTACSVPFGKSFSTALRVAQNAHRSSLAPLVACVACQESTGALLFWGSVSFS